MIQKILNLSSTAALAVTALAILAPQQASAVPAWDLNTVTGYSNGSWAFGDKFTVGSEDIVVDGLGALDVGQNGFVTAGGIQVGLYTSTGTLLASTSVTSAGTLIDFYRYSSIAALTLTAGMSYVVVAVSGSDLYNIALNAGNFSADPRITWTGYQYSQSNSLTFGQTHQSGERTWFANFNIASSGSSASVPDGGSTLALLSLAFGGVAYVRRKFAV